jgi:hypothetical protein
MVSAEIVKGVEAIEEDSGPRLAITFRISVRHPRQLTPKW